ncbi:MAG: flagellar biosynthetic protein FliR [Phycisphaeraceae bacterium]|nr:flagellar biosynthetic protein FliR [Phycisphaeraceae bacterium]
MLSLEPFAQHLVPFSLVVARLAGLFFFTPLLANRTLPRRFRALLAVMFAAAVYPALPGGMHESPPVSLVDLGPMLLAETLIGVVMGFIAGLPIISLDMAGVIAGHQMGMGLGRVYNPDLGEDTDSIGQVLMYIGLATFVALGGLDAVFLALVFTFERVPIGAMSGAAGQGTLAGAPIESIIGILTSGTELALRVAAPVLCGVFVVMIAIGLLGKTMPQINIMSVGFTIKLFMGLAVLALAMAAIQQVSSEEIERVLRLIVHWGQAMTPAEAGTDG